MSAADVVHLLQQNFAEAVQKLRQIASGLLKISSGRSAVAAGR
jgi:hypothetical protein